MFTTRRIIATYPIPELPGWELRTIELTVKPGTSPQHFHPHVGINYIVQGELHHQFEGGQVEKLRQGDDFLDLAGPKHVLIHKSGETDTIIVVSYVIKVDEANMSLAQ